MIEKNKNLNRFGFSYEPGGAHTARTLMPKELILLFTYVTDPCADKKEYRLFKEKRINTHHINLEEKVVSRNAQTKELKK